MLHNRRRRLEALAAQESTGATFWTSEFDIAVRRKIVLVVQDIAQTSFQGYAFLEHARSLILHDEGMFFLQDKYADAAQDMLSYVLSADDDMLPTAIEALASAFRNAELIHRTGAYDGHIVFEAQVVSVLREHRISFDLIDGRMVEFSSRALHVDVVAPLLTLLGGDPRWSAVERAFQDALGELSDGKPGDAITDAGTTLQEALLALGCTGNALGPLVRSARAMGLLAPHDSPMLDALERVMHWISADRSERGDAHSSTSPSVDDAWFTVHVVGAIVLRLTR